MKFPKIKKKVNDFLLNEEGKISKKNMIVGGLILGSAALSLIQSSKLVSAGEWTYQHRTLHVNSMNLGNPSQSENFPHPEAVVQGQHQHHLSHASHAVYSDSPPNYGGGDDGWSVICTELTRQGYLTKQELKYEEEYRLRFVDNQTYIGYRILAGPIVKLMKISKIFTLMVYPFVKSWANYTQYILEQRKNNNLFGQLIDNFGRIICKIIYKINFSTNKQITFLNTSSYI